MKTPEETSKKRPTGLQATTFTIVILTAFAVQSANLGYYNLTAHFEMKHQKPKQKAQTVVIAKQPNYPKLLQETRAFLRNKEYAKAASKLDQLVKSEQNKILLEVAKIRIRRDTPLYSYTLASNLLLSLINVKSLRGEASFLLARHHMRALDAETQRKAEAFLHQAVEWEYEKAHAYLGDIYSRGIGNSKKLIVALGHYETAAETFSAAPIVAFARRIAAFKPGENDCGINPERIVERYLPALQTEARSGKKSAAKELGRIFYKGKIVKRDIAEARKWLTDAAETGDAGAMRDLAILEMKYPKSENSMEFAISLLEKSATAGNASAYTSLGRIYLKEKTQEMQEKAIRAFETAALSGHKGAINELTKLSDDNVGIDFVVTGSISSARPSDNSPKNTSSISEQIVGAASQITIDESHLCEMPKGEKLKTVSTYLD